MKCDLHVHTFYSYDSTALPKEMVDAALKKGVDCLAITDHGEIQGVLEAMNYASNKPILIIPGIEIKTKEGDVLGLNIKEKIPNGISAKETIGLIKEKGGIAIIPHPFALFYPFKGSLKKLLKEIDGIEVLNASVIGSGNKKALDFAKNHNIPFIAGSDAHFPNFIGKTYLEIPEKNLTIEEILEAIKNRDCKIGGKEAGFFEKIIDHLKRNLAKIEYHVARKKRKV